LNKTVWVSRHGETELNASGIVQGQGMDAPLNIKGFEQAESFWKVYSEEPFDLVLYSNLIRSQQSVQRFLTSGVQGVELADLREISWGVNEGKQPTPDVLQRYHAVIDAWQSGDFAAAVEGGESAIQLAKRAQTCITYFNEINRKNILVCTHGRTIRVLACLMLNRPLTAMEDFHHANLGLYRFDMDGDGWQCTLYNDIRHLQGL